MPVLVGKIDWLFSHVCVQIIYRAISEVKCFSLQEICKDRCSEPRSFLLFQVIKSGSNSITLEIFLMKV